MSKPYSPSRVVHEASPSSLLSFSSSTPLYLPATPPHYSRPTLTPLPDLSPSPRAPPPAAAGSTSNDSPLKMMRSPLARPTASSPVGRPVFGFAPVTMTRQAVSSPVPPVAAAVDGITELFSNLAVQHSTEMRASLADIEKRRTDVLDRMQRRAKDSSQVIHQSMTHLREAREREARAAAEALRAKQEAEERAAQAERARLARLEREHQEAAARAAAAAAKAKEEQHAREKAEREAAEREAAERYAAREKATRDAEALAKREADTKRATAVAAAATKQRQQTEAAATAATAATAAAASKDNGAHTQLPDAYQQIVQFMKTHVNPIMKQPEHKATAAEIRKRITMRVGQLTNFRDKLNQVFMAIDKQLQEARQQGLPREYYFFALNVLAKSLCRQAEKEMRPQVTKAFPYAQITVLIMARHPEFGRIYFARLYKFCPFLVPWFPVAHTEAERKSLLRQRATEPMEKYVERMEVHAAMFGAILQTTPIVASLKNPTSFDMAWEWLARVFNSRPEVQIVFMIEKFLVLGGAAFLMQFPKQGPKMLDVLVREYAPQLGDDVRPVLARLENYWNPAQSRWVIPVPADRDAKAA